MDYLSLWLLQFFTENKKMKIKIDLIYYYSVQKLFLQNDYYLDNIF